LILINKFHTSFRLTKKNALNDCTVITGVAVMIHRPGLRRHQTKILLSISCWGTWKSTGQKLHTTEDVGLLRQSWSPLNA